MLSPRMNSGFVVQWTLNTLMGFLLSLLLIEVGERPDIGLIEGLTGGTLIGIMQWLVLRSYVPQAWLWVILSSVSWAAIAGSGLGPIGWIAPRTLSLPIRLYYGLWEGAKVGLILGTGQSLLLMQKVPQAWRWIVASTLDWAIALTCGWAMGGWLRIQFDRFLGDVIGLGCMWMIVGGLTGFALTLLLKTKKT